MRLIDENPLISTRAIAGKLRISNGSAFYALNLLIKIGYIKIQKCKNNSQKKQYSYILTPKGIREKSKLTYQFIVYKHEEFICLSKEINALKHEVGLEDTDYIYDK